jgi:deazaflavin-dependent oxidoreductase (nitroreductase family)
MTESFKAGGPDWQDRHLDAYLKTGGKIGHLVDFSPAGSTETPCLILQTIGRKSGQPQTLPLIYGKDGQNFVIVASKGGAPAHPAWFLNLEANPSVKFQILDAKYSGTAKTVEGAERQRLFDMMAKIYPPYIPYQEKTDREIPVVVLHPETTIDKL